MKEKLLALLQTKFTGVDNAILDRIATKKSENVTDEAQLPTIAEGIGFQDVLPATATTVQGMRSRPQSRTTRSGITSKTGSLSSNLPQGSGRRILLPVAKSPNGSKSTNASRKSVKML